jgi:hypothetical protein
LKRRIRESSAHSGEDSTKGDQLHFTSNRPVEDWGKLLGDAAAVSAMLDRLLHHAHVLKCGPRSWRTRQTLQKEEAARQWPTRVRDPRSPGKLGDAYD